MKPRAPKTKSLTAIVVLILAGSAASAVAGWCHQPWGYGALLGWLLAGLLGLSGWWTSRKALGGDQQALLKYLVGGMLVRMLLCGVGAAVVMLWKLTHQNGFILGLLAGIAVFLGVEVIGLHAWARQMSAARSA